MLTEITYVHNVSYDWFIDPGDPWGIYMCLYWPGKQPHDGCWFMLKLMVKS